MVSDNKTKPAVRNCPSHHKLEKFYDDLVGGVNISAAVRSLKKVAENFDERLDALVTEARVTARPDHPGIIPICGLSCDDDNGSRQPPDREAGRRQDPARISISP